jgi:gamma-glutamylcyclotransferase (GGCT)/AIG2-like uncharacterized protein YtfP
MYYVTYVSSAASLMHTEELHSLLEQSQKNNHRLGITGVLLYKEGNFIQLIEGEERTVRDLFEVIKQDVRHKNVIKLLDASIGSRIFPEWSMGFCNMHEHQSRADYDEYFSETIKTSTFSTETEFIRRVFVSFNKDNY